MDAEIYFCDVCNSSIPLKDIQAGKASVIDGKTFCAACRPGKGISGDDLKVFFCDSCNGSISIPDIKSNRAVMIGGKLYCNRCKPLEKGSHFSPAPAGSAPVRAGHGPAQIDRHIHLGVLFLLFLILLCAATVGVYSPEIRNSLSFLPFLGEEASSISAAEERADLLAEADQSAVEKIDAALKERIEPKLALFKESMEERFNDFRDEKKRFLGELDFYKRFMEIQEKNLGTLYSDLSRLQKDFLRLKGKYDDLSWELTTLVENMEQARREDVADARKKKPAEPEQENEEANAYLDQLLADLKDKDPSVRYNAVVNLNDLGDRRAVPAMIEVMKKDREFVVRKFAAQALGKIGDNTAVEPLIKALDDSNDSVAASAIVALQKITGIFHKSQFKEGDSLKVQEEAVKEWKKWWTRNRNRYKK